ncbi:kinase-like domain-containing protein [Chaetomium sp. MPI-SDFR-AT-0129]|nr:kinase-like domain-containing protein [Chaetomium sp. MPI-SDFR-AT-0129]
MAATITHSQFSTGLHPLQSTALVANGGGQLQQEPAYHHPRERPQRGFDGKPFNEALGTFARVCLVKLSHSTEPNGMELYALKVLRKDKVIMLRQIDHVYDERRILDQVQGHPFITSFVTSFSDQYHLYMVLEYVPGGEIFSHLRKSRRFSEEVARFYAAEIVLTLEYLHEHQGGIAYRDIKPENLVLDAEGHIKLVDFGFAKRLGTDESGNPKKTYTLCGTPEYMAPEVIRGEGYTTAVDWWALGILIYEFLTGYPPFGDYNQISKGTITFPQEPAINVAAQNIIRQLCTVNSACRLGNISGGAARVKAHAFFEGVDWDAVFQKQHRGPITPQITYPGDTQFFEPYPEEDSNTEEYSEQMAAEYPQLFKDF